MAGVEVLIRMFPQPTNTCFSGGERCLDGSDWMDRLAGGPVQSGEYCRDLIRAGWAGLHSAAERCTLCLW
jgi:hypothetical protein